MKKTQHNDHRDIKELHDPMLFFAKKMCDHVRLGIEKVNCDFEWFYSIYQMSWKDWTADVYRQCKKPNEVYWIACLSDGLGISNKAVGEYFMKKIMNTYKKNNIPIDKLK